MTKNFKNQKFNNVDIISILIIILLIGAIFGFMWETSFYRLFMNDFAKRGTAFGPVVPIYGVGAVLIVLMSYGYKDHPILIFLINTFILGLLEYVTGWALYEFFDVRLWDYNTEIWNFGNLNGFICARSIGAFGFAGLFLIYVVLPCVTDLIKNVKIKRPTYTYVTFSLLAIFMLDNISYILFKALR